MGGSEDERCRRRVAAVSSSGFSEGAVHEPLSGVGTEIVEDLHRRFVIKFVRRRAVAADFHLSHVITGPEFIG